MFDTYLFAGEHLFLFFLFHWKPEGDNDGSDSSFLFLACPFKWKNQKIEDNISHSLEAVLFFLCMHLEIFIPTG